MSVTVDLLQTSDPVNKITKTTSNIASVSCVIKNDCSIMDPVLLLDITNITGVFNCNYVYISDFGRYYHVRNIKTISDKHVEINCHVDVLMSFSSGIKAAPCIVAKNATRFNLYINDPNYKCKQNDIVLLNSFPAGFPNGQDSRFILTIFGDKA